MSLSSLANEEVVRTGQDFLRERFRPRVKDHLERISANHGIAADKLLGLTDAVLPLVAETPSAHSKTAQALDSNASNALDGLARYIPVEAITLYVAAAAAMPALKNTFAWVTEASVYWLFAALTPILFVLVYIGKRRAVQLPTLPQSPRNWPWWKAFASTVAFLVWALAMPTAPYLTGQDGKILAGFGAILVSTFLTLLEPLFEG